MVHSIQTICDVLGQILEVTPIEVVSADGKDTAPNSVEPALDECLPMVLWGNFATDVSEAIERGGDNAIVCVLRLPKDELPFAVVQPKPLMLTNGVGDKNDFFFNTPRKTISQMVELNRCIVMCTIAAIDSDMGWYYLSCNVCSKKVLNVPNDTIDDGEDDDKLGFHYYCGKCKLLHHPCNELTGTNIDEMQDPADIPLALKDLVGKTYLFKVGIEKENFLYKNDTYKVLKIVANIEMVTEFEDLSQPKGEVNTLSLENSLISDGPERSLMLSGGSSQEAEANALTPAKRRGTTVFNLEEHYDENSDIQGGGHILTEKEIHSFALKFTPLPSSRSRPSFSVSCTIAKDPPVLMSAGSDPTLWQRPDSFGRFGKFGGKYVPETLMHALSELETAFHSLATDDDFQIERELAGILKDYVGRESPLYFAERLTEHYRRENGEGPLIYLKREDLNHTGAHKINNAVAQALLAKRLGKKRIIAETGAGQHGVATATVCARFGLECIIYMGAQDMERQALNDATSEAIRDWVTNVETTHYILGSVAGPHPYPMMVRDFHAVIGKETRRQALEKWGGKPDVLVACVGGGSNAMGLFHEFVDDTEIRLIGVEAAGFGVDSGKHAATLTKGDVGVLHGAMSYLLQDDDGQIIEPHSISAGLDYPGVGPEHSFLKDMGRAEYFSVTDEEALEAFKRVSRLEGIIPALETSHALAHLEKLCPTLPDGSRVVLNFSGRGDKDVQTVAKYLEV
ncbi:hypothetical protein HID58_087778 [Brassica napus]|uniref:tryptophan synthase n=1 Tax=Brassica napus TaxID=3708 RepID=A0ABQ7XU91_BRANA|nr:hypothetical protein HID58_087778 [Brassica napus]